MRSFRTILFPALLIALPALAQDVYRIDPVHSQVGFKVRHIVAKTSGRFTKFEGAIAVDNQDVTKSTVDVKIEVASINTDNQSRDAHLQKPEFFDAAKFPFITFKSTSVKEVAKGHLEVTGDLTMHGVTKRITFPITNLGTHAGMRPGSVVAGFGDGVLKLNRHDFGVSYGKGVIGDEVDIELDIEAEKAEAKTASK